MCGWAPSSSLCWPTTAHRHTTPTSSLSLRMTRLWWVSSATEIETNYRSEVSRLAGWCSDNNLSLNVEKTKEIVVDFRRVHSLHAPLTINGGPCREWAAPSSWVCTSQRTSPGPTTLQHWPRKHNSVSTSSANSEEPEPRPPSCAPSTEAPSRAFWLAASLCGMAPATRSCRKSLQRIVRAAEKIVGVSLPSLQDIYSTRLTRKALSIAGDPTHPTHSFFSLLPSGRRLRSLQARTNRLKDSFIHQAVRKLNSLPSLPPLPSLTTTHHWTLTPPPTPPPPPPLPLPLLTPTTHTHTHCDQHQSLCTALDWPHSTTSSGQSE